jgi:4-hydroxybenzoate polyprenyltransferase
LRAVQKFLTFLVYSNLFIAGCTVLMVDQTYRFLLHRNSNVYFLLFVFFSTICSYSFHWYLTTHSEISSARVKWLENNRKIHVLFFFIGLTGCLIFSFYLIDYWPWLLLAAVVTFLYSAPKIPLRYFRLLRKIAIGKTIFLALVWMYVTTVLPVIISGQEWKNGYAIFAISRFFFIFSICILFDYRDKQDDKAAGIRSLITFFNEKGIFYLFTFSLIIFGITTVMLYNYDYKISSVILLLIPGIITGLLYNYARKNFSDVLYYFILDGLMAFSALLMLIPGI